ncbi:MAG: riboflavin deaminase [Leptolyngbya sp. DLM2.Bin27]|nr:MAG: riboflavin deaminase [Leptolyngbya sp. DLM2.Bin27]
MSLDGKIADAQRGAARFSSVADLAHLEAQVAAVDGVLFGGGTLRAYGTTLSVRNSDLIAQRQRRGQPAQPIQIVWSPSGNLDPGFRYFRQPIPRGLLTRAAVAADWVQSGLFDTVWPVPEARTQPWDWPWVLAQFKAAGLHTLALLGGGGLAAELLHWGCIHEILITVCPLILGGSTAPTPVEGEGFLAAAAPRWRLLSHRVIDGEVFLHYQAQPSPPAPGPGGEGSKP